MYLWGEDLIQQSPFLQVLGTHCFVCRALEVFRRKLDKPLLDGCKVWPMSSVLQHQSTLRQVFSSSEASHSRTS